MIREGPPRSNKVKVRRLDGEYEGLEEWVPKVRLVVPWEEVEALLEDEQDHLRRAYSSGTSRSWHFLFFDYRRKSRYVVRIGVMVLGAA